MHNPRELAIDNFYKWFKPDGKLVLIEHIKSQNHKFANFQNKLNPMWEKFAEAC
jgi:hypothetical protein